MNKEELTWEDAKRIVEIARETMITGSWRGGMEEYYTEVLRRFKEQ